MYENVQISTEMYGNVHKCTVFSCAREVKKYISIDSAQDDDNQFIKSSTPNVFPSYKLQIKVGAITILLRNINLNDGLL